MPDRIVLTWQGDPRTTQSVTWRTTTEVTTGLAEIAEAKAEPYFTEKAVQVASSSQLLETDINTARFHTVAFNKLRPGTRYAYRVGDGTNWSEWFHFSTAAGEDEPFSFIYFGDAQNNIRSMWSRVVREAQRDAPKAAFMLHAGDLINSAESDAEWGEWFGAGGWLNAMIPCVATPGNHEQAKAGDGRRLSHHWRASFAFPENGPPGLEESCYTMVYHNVRLISLNSNERQADQAIWLDQVLSENKSPWVICTFHHPIFSTGRDRDNAELRALWKPIIDKYRVDLVLQGHDHTYGRTSLTVPNQLNSPSDASIATPDIPLATQNVATGVQNVDTATGTIYVVSVSGPKMYNVQRHSFMPRVAEDLQLYQVIHIDGDTLTYEAKTAVGELYDSFKLNKRAGQINELIEIASEVPEHLRPQADKPKG